MKSYRKSALNKSVIDKFVCRQTGLVLVPIIVVALWLTPTAPAQSGSAPAAQPPAQSQTQSQPPAQPSSQSSLQAMTPADASSQPQSLADAARQANAQKDKPKAKHVYTDDNLSSIHGTISVVGDGSSRGSSGNRDSNQNSAGAAPVAAGNNSEAYWRSRARAIKDQITSTDQQIADVKAEIAKSGAASFDPSSGLAQGVIIIHDRNAEVKQLEDRKRSLENQLDELADEARKAGADSGWAR
jgi:hypothetical protein